MWNLMNHPYKKDEYVRTPLPLEKGDLIAVSGGGWITYGFFEGYGKSGCLRYYKAGIWLKSRRKPRVSSCRNSPFYCVTIPDTSKFPPEAMKMIHESREILLNLKLI